MDFDEVINRHGTYCTQWDYAVDRFGSSDVIPFSISDADFAVPDEILAALRSRLDHPILGYTRWNHNEFKLPVVEWFARRGGANVDPEWIVYSPSVIFTVASLIRLKSNPGDTVVTFSPMYDAFFGAIRGNGRMLAPVNLSSAMDGYQIDWEGLESSCSDPLAKVFLLTNPLIIPVFPEEARRLTSASGSITPAISPMWKEHPSAFPVHPVLFPGPQVPVHAPQAIFPAPTLLLGDVFADIKGDR